MKNNRLYQSFDRFIYRTPILPFTDLNRIIGFEGEFPVITPLMAEGIYLASPVLYDELIKMLNGNLIDNKERNRIITSAIKYISRMSTRCTPFGLFASCSIGQIGSASDFILHEQYQRSTKLDMYYLCSLVQTISKQPDIKRQLRYFPNNTLYRAGRSLRYVEFKYEGIKRKHTLSSVKYDRYLSVILSKSKSGILIDEILAYLLSEDIDKDSAIAYINALIEGQILVSELNVTVTGTPYMERIINVLFNLNDKASQHFAESLSVIDSLLKQLDNGPIEKPVNVYKRVIEIAGTNAVPVSENYLFQVDTFRNSSVACIGKNIMDELHSVINLFCKTMPKQENAVLENFKRAFWDRYETESVPLSLALDSEIGIGYPIGNGIADISPLVDQVFLPQNKKLLSDDIQTIFLDKFLNREQGWIEEIILSDKDFTASIDKVKHLPNTIYAVFQIIEDSCSKTLLNIKGIGSSAANLLSRFSHIDPQIQDVINTISSKEKELTSDGIIAEIIHLPSSRVGNIITRTHVRDYELVYLTSSELPQSNQIMISDLELSCRNGTLSLFSKRLNKKVYPRLTSAHNYHNDTLPVYRFLCDFQHQNTITGFGLSWEMMDRWVNYRPRVRYKNCILSPAAWKIEKEELADFFQLGKEELCQKVSEWREKRKIPCAALLTEGDNELYVDFNVEWSIRAFLSAVKNKKRIEIIEFLFSNEDLVVKGENEKGYLNECIVLFNRKT